MSNPDDEQPETRANFADRGRLCRETSHDRVGIARDQQPPEDLDTRILRAAGELGYDAAKVRRWVNQKFEVTGGLTSLTDHDKREVLKIFTEQSRAAPTKTARR